MNIERCLIKCHTVHNYLFRPYCSEEADWSARLWKYFKIKKKRKRGVAVCCQNLTGNNKTMRGEKRNTTFTVVLITLCLAKCENVHKVSHLAFFKRARSKVFLYAGFFHHHPHQQTTQHLITHLGTQKERLPSLERNRAPVFENPLGNAWKLE